MRHSRIFGVDIQKCRSRDDTADVYNADFDLITTHTKVFTHTIVCVIFVSGGGHRQELLIKRTYQHAGSERLGTQSG